MITHQFLIYVAVGIISALIDIGLIKLFIFHGTHHLIAATIGFATGLTVNFLLHSRITFKKKYSHSTLVRYISAVFLNYTLTLLAIHLFHACLAMPILGKIVSLPLITINGFFLSKHWIYKETKSSNEFKQSKN